MRELLTDSDERHSLLSPPIPTNIGTTRATPTATPLVVISDGGKNLVYILYSNVFFPLFAGVRTTITKLIHASDIGWAAFPTQVVRKDEEDVWVSLGEAERPRMPRTPTGVAQRPGQVRKHSLSVCLC